MRITVKLFLAALACMGLVTSAGCLNQESVASRVATEWVTDSEAVVTEEFVRLTIGEVPFVSQLARSVLEDQVRDNVTWEFTEAECASGDECELTATAIVHLDISLPFDGDKIFVVSLPFDLRVDTERQEVTRWTPDIAAASFREVR